MTVRHEPEAWAKSARLLAAWAAGFVKPPRLGRGRFHPGYPNSRNPWLVDWIEQDLAPEANR